MPFEILDDQKEKFEVLERQPDAAFTPIVKQPPSLAKQLGQGFMRGVRPALEIGGMLAGGAVGTAAAPGLGTVGGAGLGYAGGRQLANLLEQSQGQRQQQGLGQELLGAGRDVVVGGAMEAGGGIAGKALQKGIASVAKAAPRIYESVLKGIPRSISRYKKNVALTTALEGKISPTQKGILKLKDKIEVAGENIGNTIMKAQKSGDKINTSDLLKHLDEVEKEFRASDLSDMKLLKLQKYKDRILKNTGETLTPKAALDMKKSINKEISSLAYKLDPKLTEITSIRKKIVEGITSDLVSKYPQLESQNVTYSNLKTLEEVIEKTAEKNQGALMSLGDIGATGTGAILGGKAGAAVAAATSKILNTPIVMSHLAFMLHKAGKAAAPYITPRAVAYGIGKATGATESDPEAAITNILNATTPSAEAAEMTAPRPDHTKASPAIAIERAATQSAMQGWESMSPAAYERSILLFEQAKKMDPSKADKYDMAIETAKKEMHKMVKYKQKHMTEIRNMPVTQNNI